MRKYFAAFFITLASVYGALGQVKSEIAKSVETINQMLDNAVVAKDVGVLEKHYGDDFVFTHGTGLVDSKESWIMNIKKLSKANRFTSRQHDSTEVELHDSIAIVSGTLTVSRLADSKTVRYALQYIRVYAKREKIWQLISHRTTKEWHL